jgi:hypothetical protein
MADYAFGQPAMRAGALWPQFADRDFRLMIPFFTSARIDSVALNADGIT